MSDNLISERQSLILGLFQIGRALSLGEVLKLLAERHKIVIAAPTLRRDIATLCTLEFVLQAGSRKSTKYSLNPNRLTLLPIDAQGYCQQDVDTRLGESRYNFELFTKMPCTFFGVEELMRLNDVTQKYLEMSQAASSTIQKKELERFVIELSWKSSKIEGNTYTLLDTELLIKEGIEAGGRTREEAIMILNHKDAFDFVVRENLNFQRLTLSGIVDVHRLLTKDLNIAHGLRTRMIGITGSLYRPLQVPSQIEESCDDMIAAVDRMQEPYSKALAALAGISYIQPFEDGNKRTSRLIANAILLANGCAPLSYRSVSEIKYREAMLTFYEKNSLVPLKALFIEQYVFACENYLRFI